MWARQFQPTFQERFLPRSKYVTALDIGTTKICCVVGEPTERGLNIVGFGESSSEGLRRGVVVNMEKTVRGISHAVDAAQRMCGHKVESAFVGMAGTHVLSQNSRGVVAVARSDREIGHEDVSRVIDAARAVSVPNDREIIHVVPRGYIVDGQEGVRDAVGMSGARLEVETHIITGSLTAVQNVVKCVHQAGLSVEDLVVQVLASAEAVLNDNELDLGVAVGEVGRGTTCVALFTDGGVRHTAVWPVGGFSAGGGCRLRGFAEGAQSLLELPVRIGAPAQPSGMSDQGSGPAYATAVGLLRWGTKLRHHANGHAPVGPGVSAAYAR